MNPYRDIWDFIEEEQQPLKETPSSIQQLNPLRLRTKPTEN